MFRKKPIVLSKPTIIMVKDTNGFTYYIPVIK